MFRILRDGKTVVEGDSPLTIPNLTPNTEYKADTYKYEYEEDGQVSDQHDIPVIKTKPVAVTGISLDKTTLALKVGASGQLTATIAPTNASNKGFVFSSSDIKVTTVDNAGKVMAVANGTATITAKSNDGGKTATCAITVTTAVTGVTLDNATISGKPGDKGKLTPTIAPATASNKAFTFTSSAADVIKIDNAGNWEMLKDGSADLTVKTTDGGKTAVCKGTCATPEPEPPAEG
ncbi:MAG TPA: Ig-like domain-containing protein [Candidatus Jeotgalibaca merdavium]|uniref:Ig-like domain-containing protein n=1 Tax=Candidatus Jeotgalibaca merdavium TaxID=2838627 RepID=A0A9D2HXT4_9LACT|nr:Ig-like domain-containing protein [Candidatus Jeotgalibaca merdavium]